MQNNLFHSLSKRGMIASFFLLLLFMCCTPTAEPQSVSYSSNSLISRRALFNAMRDLGKVVLVYHQQNEKVAKAYAELMADVKLSSRIQLEVEVQADTVLSEDFMKENAVVLIGDFEEHPVFDQLLQKLPIQKEVDRFQFADQVFDREDNIFKLFLYPNPYNPAIPISIITGNENESIINYLKSRYDKDWSRMFWASWGYELYEGTEMKMIGYFSDSTWQMDKTVHFEFNAQGDTLAISDHFVFISEDKEQYENEMEGVALACENNYQKMCRFLGKEPSDFRLDYRIHSSMETKGLQFNNTDLMHLDENKQSVHVIWNDHMKGTLQQGENKALVAAIIGRSNLAAMEDGLALQFADAWHNKGIRYWAGLLYTSGNMPTVEDLLDQKLYERESDLVMEPAATLFVEYLISKYGMDTFLTDIYRNWKRSEQDVAQAQKEWDTYLQKAFVGWKPDLRAKLQLDYCKGFNFAHEGYRIYNGYGSSLAKASIQKLSNLGTNALAIVPYAYMRDPNRPTYFNLEHSPGSENDESVIFANAKAKELGMYTLMKPQIWMGRSWPGEVMMKTEEDWDAFFDYYYRWIRHYALLAEMYHYDGLSLGVEFAKATIAQPKRWRRLIKKIRPLFSGDLTYCANWGTEFEQFEFWDEFDYIGLNCYYPLGKGAEVSREALAAKFETIMGKVEKVTQRFDKPLVFTEIGFRSVERTWENPHEETQGRGFNEQAQALCYEVVFEGIKDEAWCKGMMWWKWPSYLGYQGQENTSFTPNRKSAEKVVKKWFKKL